MMERFSPLIWVVKIDCLRAFSDVAFNASPTDTLLMPTMHTAMIIPHAFSEIPRASMHSAMWLALWWPNSRSAPIWVVAARFSWKGHRFCQLSGHAMYPCIALKTYHQHHNSCRNDMTWSNTMHALAVTM